MARLATGDGASARNRQACCQTASRASAPVRLGRSAFKSMGDERSSGALPHGLRTARSWQRRLWRKHTEVRAHTNKHAPLSI